MTFFTLCANCGVPCATQQGDLIAPSIGTEVIEQIRRVTSLLEPSNFAIDPIAASEAMARPDALVSVMPLGYGYVSYSREGFRPRALTFTDIPLPERRGSVLGGTGIAVSAFSTNLDQAKAYAAYVASAGIQAGLYPLAGGQPSHRAGWDSPSVNAAVHDFYRSTRATVDASYVRPRHRGYMAFQDAAAKRINAGLLSNEAPTAIVTDLNSMFRGSF